MISPLPRRARAGLAVVLATVALGVARPAAADQVVDDSTFGQGGAVSFDFDGALDSPSAVVLQPDGKILVAGSATIAGDSDLAVLRLLPDGSPDPTFSGGTGTYLYDSGGWDTGSGVALAPDGRIVAVGDASGQQLVIRLLADGTPDPSFDTDGVVVASQGSFGAVLVQGDGRIVVGGTTPVDYIHQSDAVLARYTTAGALDPTFGTGGQTVVDTGSSGSGSLWESVASLAQLDDGAFAAAGKLGRSSYNPNDDLSDTLFFRFTAGGSLDAGFNGTGYRSFNFGGPDEGVGVLADSGGRAVFGAKVYNATVALLRLSADGSLDPTFGSGGQMRTGPRLEAMARGVGGTILVASGGLSSHLVRYTHDGAIDTSFGGGSYESDLYPGTEFPSGIAVLPDGRVLYASRAYYTDTDSDWLVQRVTFAPDPPAPAPSPQPAPNSGRSGYWMASSSGGVYAFGDAHYYGAPQAAMVAITASPSGNGYWAVGASGAVYAFGDARFLGGNPALRAGESVASLSATPDGAGYWLFTNQGRAFAYGAARHFGDMGATRLNGPVLGSVATPSGNGYYMVASDGGIFAFGDAAFSGSMGGRHLNGPIVGLAPDPDGSGYWLVASDGGIFAFDAPFRGSAGAIRLNKPVIGMVAYGNGYLMVASDGGIFNYSDKAFVGSLGASPPPAPIVGVTALR